MRRYERVAGLTLGALLLLPASVSEPRAETAPKFCTFPAFKLRDGETRTGDVYIMANNLDVGGQQQGDLLALAQAAVISGEVTGDLMLMGKSLEISGRVGDTVRFFGESVNVTGVVDGDLLVFAGSLNIHPRGHVTGDVIAFSGSGSIDGTVDGDVKFQGGEIALSGTVGRSVRLKVDTIKLDPQARIGGDLIYTSRKPLELEGREKEIVTGEVRFEPKEEKEDDEDESLVPTFGDVMWWAWFAGSALLVGVVALALFGRAMGSLVAPIREGPMVGLLVGFGTFLVVPAAAALAILLIISLPLGVLTLFLFLVALYVAKMPVAVWLGRRLLSLLGRPDASPYLALVLGLFSLYLLFALPYIGWLVWLTTTWLGLGAMILALRSHLQAREARP